MQCWCAGGGDGGLFNYTPLLTLILFIQIENCYFFQRGAQTALVSLLICMVFYVCSEVGRIFWLSGTMETMFILKE